MFWCNKSHAQTRCLQYIRCVLWVALVCRMQQDPEVIRIENMIDYSRRLSFQLDFMDVWDPNYRLRFAERDAVNAKIDEANRAYDEKAAAKAQLTATHNAAMAYMQQMAAAELEREAASERAKMLCKQRVWYMEHGCAYMVTARELDDPTKQLEAANAALACFRRYHALSAARAEVNIMIADAEAVAAAAQAELDKPRVFKILEFVCELLVTG